MSDEAARHLIQALGNRITKILPAQIRTCLEKLTDEEIWWRPNESSNSVGNNVLHVSGSLNHYLNRAVGGFAYERDRAAEFAERGPVPREQLLATFEDMVTKSEQTFAALTPERLAEPSIETKMYDLIVEDLVGVAVHIAFHAGQIVWITKMLHGNALHEEWMKTHKELGGWKRPR